MEKMLLGSRNTFLVGEVTDHFRFISGGTNANISTSANTVPIGQWTHVAFVLNNSTGYLYINGIQKATGNLSTVNTPSGNQKVKIGQRVSGGSIPFRGSLDEIRIWNVAKSVGEIQASMNNELCSTDPNLKLYFQFNEGTAGRE